MSKIQPSTRASIIAALGGNPATGMCRCPVHDDRNASLKVSEGRGGRVIVYCFAGCAQDAVVEALRTKGVWPRQDRATVASDKRHEDDEDGFRDAFSVLRAAAWADARPTDYLRGRGITAIPESVMLLPAKLPEVRIGKRTYRVGLRERAERLVVGYPAMVVPVVRGGRLVGMQATRLDRRAQGKLNTKGPERVTLGVVQGGYVRLGPTDPKRPLVVAEGAETALSAMQITGLPGIATAGAANLKSVTAPECRELIIAADNDDAGSQAAEALAQQQPAGRKVRIAIPDGPKGYDWNDALQTHKDVGDLRRSILNAPLFADQRVRALPMEEFMALDFPPREFLLNPILTTSGLAMIHAARGSAKTWLSLSIAYHVATGQRLLEWDAPRARRVLYVDGELPGRLMQERLAQLGKPTSNLQVLAFEQFAMQRSMMPDLADPAGREFLNKIIAEARADLVILDSLSTLVRSVEENDSSPWAPIQGWAMEHRWEGRSIIFVHHEGRSGLPRGTSKREDVLDTMIRLKPFVPKTPTERQDAESSFELTFTKSRGFYGEDAAPMIVHLSTASGLVAWRSESMTQNVRDRVAELMKQGGWKQKDIAKELGITEGRVSQLKKEIGLANYGGAKQV